MAEKRGAFINPIQVRVTDTELAAIEKLAERNRMPRATCAALLIQEALQARRAEAEAKREKRA